MADGTNHHAPDVVPLGEGGDLFGGTAGAAGVHALDALVGEIATATEDVRAGSVGRVELRGTVWSARNETGISLARGERCRVTRVDGLMLYIVPEGVR